MKFTVYERVTLLDLLPAVHQKSSFVKLKTLNGLLSDLGFSEQELVDWKIEHKGTRITWDEDAIGVIDIELGPVATGLVLDVLRWLDEQERLDMGTLGLCEKFGYEGLEAEDEEGEED